MGPMPPSPQTPRQPGCCAAPKRQTPEASNLRRRTLNLRRRTLGGTPGSLAVHREGLRFRFFYPLLIYLVAACGGCHRPLVVHTRAKVETTVPPTLTASPLVPMRVDGDCCADGGPRVALVDVDGILLNQDLTGLYSVGENPVSAFREKLDAIRCRRCVRAVVLRINTPGGGVTACDIMRHELQRFRAETGLPIVACLMDVAAGGGYYLATAADHIVAHPTTVTGGIGVILNLYNMQDAMAQFNIIGLPVKAGQHIDLGSPVRDPSPEGREILQQMADEFHARFRQAVERSRPLPPGDRAPIFDGRVFTASQALQLRLIDEIGYLDDCIRTARSMAGLAPETGDVIVMHRRNDRARTPYAITPNVPLNGAFIPLSIPGFDRSRLPTFLYLWQPDPTLEKHAGR